MDALSIVRAKFNQAKRLEKPPDESAEPSSTVKFYPLRNQDQNRLVQIMHRESFSSSDIYTSNLHRGILNDWLGTFELQGSIKLPSSSLLSIANAAVWNSRVRFNEILANKCHPTADTSAGSANSAQSLCLTDFVVTATADVPVLDTRVPGVPQSTATCIQTVLGDNLSVAVYHKVADGSVRQIATGRIAHISALSALSAPTSSSSTTSTYLSALEQFPSVPFDVSPFQSLRHCYDLPPQLVHAALMRAVQASGRDVGNALLQVAACDCFWVNNIRLPALWSSGAACRLFYQVVSSSTGLRVCVGLSGTGGGDPGETALALYMQAEVQVQGQTGVSCLHTEHPLQAPSPSVAWELRSRWVRDDAPPSTLVTGRKVRPRKLLCLVPADNTVNVDILDGLKVREEFAGCDIQCEGWPDVHSCDTSLSLEGTNRQGESKEAAVLDVDVSQCDVVVIVLPSYREESTCDVDLDKVLALLQRACQAQSRVLVLQCRCHNNTQDPTLADSSTPLCEAISGAVLSAQLEYLKCSLSVCLLQLPGPAEVHVDNIVQAIAAEAVVSAATEEVEVLYGPPVVGNPLPRFVRRYEKTAVKPSAEVSTQSFSPDGVYVITGGLGGLGLLTAQCLLQRGARKIVLLSRSGRVPYAGQGLEERLDALASTPGVLVQVMRCDVSEEAEVVRLLAEVRQKLGAIAGVVHAAGVLSDGLIVTGKATQGARAVWEAKAKSAYLLHKLTSADAELHLFLCFSSVTAAVGTAGQSAYGAANRYMEWLMGHRAQCGLPGLSVRWPEVSGVGMAAALHGSAEGEQRPCAITACQVEEFLTALFSRLSTTSGTVTLMPPALSDLYAQTKVGKQFAGLATSAKSLLGADCGDKAVSAVAPAPAAVPSEAQIRTTVRRTLSTLIDEAGELADLGDDALLMQAGLDSLGATELSAQLSSEFRLKVPPTLIFSFPTVNEIVGYLQAALAAKVVVSIRPTIASVPSAVPLAPDAPALAPINGTAVMLDDVAIIGTSLSFPGNCSSLARLWEILLNKESTSVKTPTDRWDVDALLASNHIRDATCRARLQSAHFLTHEEPFNCLQFNMTAKEAAVIHPSHRLLLLNCQRALEDAGYAGAKLCANTGVYVGIGGVVSGTGSAAAPSEAPKDTKTGAPAAAAARLPTMSAYSATSHSVSVSAGRISFALGLSGPCMAIDTACSSSLVALHAARRALQLGECDLALVCGVNCLDASSSLACAVAGMTSPDGLCRTFDQDANGYSRAEGCGVVVLKRLGDALGDGDMVHCVVKGSAVKQDGKSASLTAPNGRAQQELLRAALKDARLQPGDVHLLETHGTGTKLGDPVEAAALAAVFGPRAESSPPLLLTAVKANVGHLEAGAGMAGLFSILLALKHGTAPPNALLRSLNEEVRGAIGDASMLPIASATPMVRVGVQPLVAGVSSFGYSGTIAHVLLQEPPEGMRRVPFAPSLSSAVSGIAPPIVAETTFDSTAHRDLAIDSAAADELNDESSDASSGTLEQVWQFAGQGDMRVGAGKELFDTEESFRVAMAECDRIVRPYLGRTISEMLYPPGCVAAVSTPTPGTAAATVPKPAAVQQAEALLAQTLNSQVALVALEYCLAAVWLAQEVTPDIVLGHSLGEYAAAVVAGVLTLEDALRLVCERGRLVQENAGCQGVMYAVRATAEDADAALKRADAATLAAASLAACNGKQSLVLSGSEAAVQRLIALLSRGGSLRLGVSHAFHSPLMRCIEAPFRDVLRQVRFSPLQPGITFVSGMRGRVVSSAELADPQYWIDHMLLSVQYVDAVKCAWHLGGRTFLEMGPQDTLTKLSRRVLDDVAKLVTQGGEGAFECMASLV